MTETHVLVSLQLSFLQLLEFLETLCITCIVASCMVNQCIEDFGMQVYSLNWNMSKRNLFLSGSWDDTIKLWDIHRPESQATFAEHTYCVYAANWYVLSAAIAKQ